jgi:3'-phosphoadenosine 5'-phosphosulfate sulfotransferase (PAPS reductase)/FAD synthetase
MTDHVVSFSGGMGSFAEAYYCVQEFGKENVVLLFCDTLTEDPDLYRFLDECVAFLGCRFVRLSRELSVWDLFKERKFIANHRIDLCSAYLKET